jgi:hypothetical protein
MNSCFETYLQTTDPETPYSELVSFDVLGSILLHCVIYLGVYKTLTLLFGVTCLKLSTVAIWLCVIMTLGYFARLYRAKTIYRAFLEEGQSEKEALDNCESYMRSGYFTFYFLA